jgi:hypothetical protein
MASTENDKLVVGLGEVHEATFGAVIGSLLNANQRLALEEILDIFSDFRTLKSDLGQAVLRDFDGAARMRASSNEDRSSARL